MTIRGKAAVVGIGQTPYYKRGTSPDPELLLAIKAIVAACEEAGIHPSEIDGFCSYGSEKSDGTRLMTALGCKELNFASLVWSHGGGIPGAVGLAAMAVATGQADVVAVYRSMAEGTSGRLRVAVSQNDTSRHFLLNGLDSPVQIGAPRTTRLLEKMGVPRSTMEAISLASYYHAKKNPSAYAYGFELDHETYDSSRWISEPYKLFDCSRENDAGIAVLVTSAERAKEMRQKPAYILSAPMGSPGEWASLEEIDMRSPIMTSAGMAGVAKKLWKESGYGPEDVDVAQVYENMTGLSVSAIVDHGFCSHQNAGEFITYDNLIVDGGGFPINTSGGNVADGFIHGMGLVPEAVRQIRGTSVNQVEGAKLSLMIGGPGDAIVSSALFGTEETL